jgi:hypothetical protein
VAGALRKIGPRPVVGVHLRRGDFPLCCEEVYDLHQTMLSAVPLWWHEWMMRAIVRRQPSVRFLLCHNGASDAAAQLKKEFEVVEVPLPNPYKRPTGHQSAHHPVADLFALACCPVILATPVSSFSHYAANVLGDAATCLLPPPQRNRAAPAVVQVRVNRRLLRHWVDACLGKDGKVLPLTPTGLISTNRRSATGSKLRNPFHNACSVLESSFLAARFGSLGCLFVKGHASSKRFAVFYTLRKNTGQD